MKIEALEIRLRETVDSTLNREDGLWAVIDAVGQRAEEYIDEKLQELDQTVVRVWTDGISSGRTNWKSCKDNMLIQGPHRIFYTCLSTTNSFT